MMSVTLIPARVKHTGLKGHTKCLSVPIKNRRSLNLTPVATSGVGEAPRSIDGSQSTYALVFSFLLCLYICDHLKSGWKICNVSSWFRMKIFFPLFFWKLKNLKNKSHVSRRAQTRHQRRFIKPSPQRQIIPRTGPLLQPARSSSTVA